MQLIITIRPKSESSNVRTVKFYYGDVWFCSGQSNMEFMMKQVVNASQVRTRGKYLSDLRLLLG